MSIFLACIHVYSGEGVRVSETGVEWLLAFMCVLGTKLVLSIRAEGVLHCRALNSHWMAHLFLKSWAMIVCCHLEVEGYSVSTYTEKRDTQALQVRVTCDRFTVRPPFGVCCVSGLQGI